MRDESGASQFRRVRLLRLVSSFILPPSSLQSRVLGRASDDLPAVHAGAQDLDGDAAADRLLLLGTVDDAEAALAERLQQPVGAQDRSGGFRLAPLMADGCLEEMPRLLVGA
jgi:hypothetical protein